MDSEDQQIRKNPDETFLFKEVTWEIPKDKILSYAVDLDVKSAPFSFAGTTWNLHLYPYGRNTPKSKGWVELVIRRLDYKPQQYVSYKFYFKTIEGKEFNPLHKAYDFNRGRTSFWLLYMRKDKFMLNTKTLITSKGDIVMVCEMRTPKIKEIKVFSQTEAEESIVASPEKEPSEEQKSIAMNNKTSSEKKSSEEQKSIELNNKASPEKKSSEEQKSITLNNKASPPKKSSDEQKSIALNNKGCDCLLRHPMPLPGTKTLRDFKQMLLKQEDCDVTLKVQGQEFSAHKNILKARSPVFASTFRSNTKEKATGVINIEDCDPSSFGDFLSFLYCGNVDKLTTDNVFSLYVTADKYDVQDLRLECVEFMKSNLSVDTFCDTIALALQYSEKAMIELTTEFFIKNIQEIIVTVKWQTFLVENPILSNELLIKALVSNKK